jgi:type IV pilus assembly protein PilN
MIRVNLLAPERPTKTSKKTRAVSATPGAVQVYLFLALFAGGALVLCAAAYWYQSTKIKKLDSDIAAAEQRQRELQAIKVQVDALEAKRRTFQQKVDLIERLKAAQSEPVHLLDEISKNLPDFVWITALDQTGPIVKITGQSSGLTSVADFISALQRSGYFPVVDLVSSSENNNIISYSLQGTFKSPEVAAKEAQAAARAPIPGSTPVRP